MALAREINMKPSFIKELYALPSNMGSQMWEKINFLAQNPIPDGSLKKKLIKWKDVYRLRVGEYRVFYTFGNNWIRLLSVRPRKNAYEGNINYETPKVTTFGSDPDIVEDEEVAAGVTYQTGVTTSASVASSPLPDYFTAKWLTDLRIPPELQPQLLECRTEDELLQCPVPDTFLERVIENLFPRPVDEIIEQPDLILKNTEDLARYQDGDLLGFLLRLDPDQERLVDWALKGPALIKGGPGTGKSTIALHRVGSIIEHAVKQGKTPPTVLFSTYTPALTKFSAQLLEQLLGEKINAVTIKTADDLAIDIVGRCQGNIRHIAEQKELKSLLEEFIKGRDVTGLSLYRTEFLLDEFEWVIDGRNMTSFEEYASTNRSGRGIPLTSKAREVIWNGYLGFRSYLQDKQIDYIPGIRRAALEFIRSGKFSERYDSVIIDEAQDISPCSLNILLELCKEITGVYLTADASQSIYYRGFSWQEVNEKLKVRGRTVVLKRNYRTTKPIYDAATAFLKASNSGDPESMLVRSTQNGTQPVLAAYRNTDDHFRFMANYIIQMSRLLRMRPSAAAVLVPGNAAGKEIADGLTAAGLPATFMKGSRFDLKSEQVKVLNLSSAKGLEFPIVIVTGLDARLIPAIPEGANEEERNEEVNHARKVLFVGMTRSMRALMVMYPEKHRSSLVDELDTGYWASSD